LTMFTKIVLTLALTGSLRGKVSKDDSISSPTVAIRTKEDLERLLHGDNMSVVIDILDTDGDKQITIVELAELELKGAEALDFELSPDDALALADGSVREDGEPSTSYVHEDHIREWFVDATWDSFLQSADANGDEVLDDTEWSQFVSMAAEAHAQLAAISPSDGWTSSFSDQLTADAASTGEAALKAASEVVGRLPVTLAVPRRRPWWMVIPPLLSVAAQGGVWYAIICSHGVC